jgi:uncharacterized membrane protein
MQPEQPTSGGPGPTVPYAYAQPYPPRPPNGPQTLGTLSIVFGAVVAGFSLFGLLGVSQSLATMTNPKANADIIREYLDVIRTPTMIHSFVFVAMSTWLLVLGVGQRRYRQWAARQSVLWAVIALVVLVGVVLMNVFVLGPAGQRMMEATMRQSHLPQALGTMTRWLGILGIVFYVPWPIILLATFRQPKIVAAMNQ